MAELQLPAQDAVERLGIEIGTRLQVGDAVCLSGPLGAGKTTLARALIRSLTDPQEPVPSPTFTLVQSYDGKDFPIAHFDLYRLKSAAEIDELGLDEALREGVALIEWPERLGDALPFDRLAIHLSPAPQVEGRMARIDGFGAWVGRARFDEGIGLTVTPDREAARRAFLAAAGYGDARREAMTGDASTRAYERLHLADGTTRIFMDQPPAAESATASPDATPDQRRALGYNALARLAGGRTDAFAAISDYLRGRGFSAPAVETFDAEVGFAVLEDLGDDLYARRIERGQDPIPLYETAVDLQAALHAEPPPAVLGSERARWPLCAYDDLALKTYTELFLEWWPRYAAMPPLPAEAAAEWEALAAPIRARAEAQARVFAHRDFHAENLIWLPKRSGLARVGLLDFQDAVRAHPAWDLLHLLQDARRDVPMALETAMLERYLGARPETDRDAFLADYRALATLNAARILGPIFARQVVAFDKRRYIDFMPRTWRYLERNLEHGDLQPLKAWFDHWIPPERRA